VGVITAVGQSVDNVKIGDRVMGVTRFGAYATHLNIGQEYVIPIPTDWTFEEGASYLVQALTAYYGLFNLGALSEGKTVLVHSAAGGVGTDANRIAKQLNAYTIGTVGGAAKIDYCKKEGYDKVIVRDKKTFDANLKQALNGRSLDLIMECIGGDIFQIGYDNLGEEGRMIVYGSAQYAQTKDKPNKLKLLWQFFNRPKIDPQGMIHLNKGILGFNLIYLYEKAPLMHQLLGELALLDIGKPNVGQTFEFANIKDAVRAFSTGKTVGKVVVKV